MRKIWNPDNDNRLYEMFILDACSINECAKEFNHPKYDIYPQLKRIMTYDSYKLKKEFQDFQKEQIVTEMDYGGVKLPTLTIIKHSNDPNTQDLTVGQFCP